MKVLDNSNLVHGQSARENKGLNKFSNSAVSPMQDPEMYQSVNNRSACHIFSVYCLQTGHESKPVIGYHETRVENPPLDPGKGLKGIQLIAVHKDVLNLAVESAAEHLGDRCGCRRPYYPSQAQATCSNI
jgi:hypothetical protein